MSRLESFAARLAGGGYLASTIDFTSGLSSDDLLSSVVATASTASQRWATIRLRLVLALLKQLDRGAVFVHGVRRRSVPPRRESWTPMAAQGVVPPVDRRD